MPRPRKPKPNVITLEEHRQARLPTFAAIAQHCQQARKRLLEEAEHYAQIECVVVSLEAVGAPMPLAMEDRAKLCTVLHERDAQTDIDRARLMQELFVLVGWLAERDE
jgi:hypothetical protein